MTHYAPYTDGTPYASLCRHCGQVEEAHHSDGRCYTTDELLARLRFALRHGRPESARAGDRGPVAPDGAHHPPRPGGALPVDLADLTQRGDQRAMRPWTADTPTPHPLRAPFPYYGGKSRAAPRIWHALGNPPNFVEPFAGSLATLLLRPHVPQTETVNDRDAFLANVWRALQADPDTVAAWCAQPPNEADLHAIHTWLVGQRAAFTARLMGDPDYYDARVAGRWLYGIACWIGGGWCSGAGPWQSIDGQLVHLGDAGQGVHRQLVHLGDAGRGVHRQRVHLGDAGRGEAGEDLYAWFAALQRRLRYVRVCCGDWTRVLGPSVTTRHGMTGVLLDPPYSAEEGRDGNLYAIDDPDVAHAVRAWCLTHGQDPLLRIVLCGYGEVHDALLPYGWRKQYWTANGGFGNQRKDHTYTNKYRETLWLSPHCLTTDTDAQLTLFAAHHTASRKERMHGDTHTHLQSQGHADRARGG